jgi:chemotaxis protein histidine kinase CheA
MPNAVITASDKQITITTNGTAEVFSMVAIPPAGSKLVAVSKNRILVNMELETLIRDLSRTGQLLFLAYCGVAGFGPLRKAITEMQDKLGVLCGDCELALNGFAEASQQVLDTLKNVFTFLLDGEEDWALDELSTCGETALGMEKEATALADRFAALGDFAVATLGDTTIQKGLSEENQRKYASQINDIKVGQAKGEALREALAESREEMETLYQEAKEKADKEDERAFIVALTGAIIGPIAAGIGGALSMHTKRGVEVPPPAPDAPMKPAKSDEVEKLEAAEKTRKDTAETEEKEQAAVAEATEEEKAEKAEAAIKELEEKAKTEAEKAAVIEAKAKEEKRAEAAEKAEKDRKEIARKEEEDRARAAGAAISAAGAEASKQFTALAADRAKAAASYNDQKMVFLKQKLELQAEERKNLVNLAGYAVQMTHAADARAIEARTTESLFQAIGALKSISAILRTNAKFWKQMAAACGRLGGSDTNALRKDITRYKGSPRKLEYYLRDDFKLKIVNYYANWKALESVSAEYCKIAAQVGKEVLEDFKKNPTNDESRRWAVAIGSKLSISANEQIAQGDKITEAMTLAASETAVPVDVPVAA